MKRIGFALLMSLLVSPALGDTTPLDRCLVKLQAILEWKDPAAIKPIRKLPLDDALRAVGVRKGVHFSSREASLSLCRKDVKAYDEEAQ